MQDSTEDSRNHKTQCISGQEKLVQSLVDAVVDTKLLNKKITELDAKVDRNDKKHTDAINSMHREFTEQHKLLIDNMAEFKVSFDLFIEKVDPYVTKVEGAKGFINKWSPIVAIGSLLLLAFGDKAEKAIALLIKVAG